VALADLRKLVHRQYQVRIYEYPASLPRTPGPDPPPGYTVKHLKTFDEVPPEIARVVMPGRFVDLMRWRMQRGRASLLVVFDAKGDMASYCWIQSWKPYSRPLGKVAPRGRMVGFGWVSPDHRQRGLFTFMVRRAVIFVDPSEPPLGYAVIENPITMRACEKADYAFIGEVRVRRVLWFLNFSTVVARPGSS